MKKLTFKHLCAAGFALTSLSASAALVLSVVLPRRGADDEHRRQSRRLRRLDPLRADGEGPPDPPLMDQLVAEDAPAVVSPRPDRRALDEGAAGTADDERQQLSAPTHRAQRLSVTNANRVAAVCVRSESPLGHWFAQRLMCGADLRLR